MTDNFNLPRQVSVFVKVNKLTRSEDDFLNQCVETDIRISAYKQYGRSKTIPETTYNTNPEWLKQD